MANEATDVRIPVDETLRGTLDEAKALTGVTTYTDVFRLALTTLVRKLKTEAPQKVSVELRWDLGEGNEDAIYVRTRKEILDMVRGAKAPK